MAPRKRGRPSAAATSSPPPSTTSRRERSTSSMPSTAPSAAESSHQVLLDDLWTDAEETALFKQLIRYKPIGLHKHMSMLSIYTTLLSQGYVRDDPLPTPFDDDDGDTTMKGVSTSGDRHMSIRGIWRKLNELYDLEALDEREGEVDFERAFGETVDEEVSSSEEEEPEAPPPRRGRPKKKAESPSTEASSPSPAPIGREFTLPSSDESDVSDNETSFAALKWAKRFATASPSIETSGPPSPSAGHTKRGRRSRAFESEKEEKQRRDSSLPEMPDLLPSRTERPVRFTPSFEVPADDEDNAETPRATRGRGRGRPAGRARGAALGGRRSSHVVPESESEEKEIDSSDEEEEEGEDEDEDSSSSSSGEEQDEESPQKKKRGRPSRGGRVRGQPARGRGRKK